jgi:hypothetical protein
MCRPRVNYNLLCRNDLQRSSAAFLVPCPRQVTQNRTGRWTVAAGWIQHKSADGPLKPFIAAPVILDMSGRCGITSSILRPR